MSYSHTDKPDPRFDPDARFILANDRTMLAWVRTAIGLLAGGMVVAHVGEGSARTMKLLAVALIIAGILTVCMGYRRYKSADSAIRRGELPHTGSVMQWQTGGVLLISLALVVIVTLT